VDRRPDEENRATPDIDAVAASFAIEHTSIDSLLDQRRHDDWFMSAVGDIERELESVPPFRLNITLKYDAIVKGQNWPEIRAALKRWLTNEAPLLPDGKRVIENLPGIPFPLQGFKSAERSPGFFFARFEPDDKTLSERIKKAFDRKAAKLAKYDAPGITTILLVENNDIALMNGSELIEAIRIAFPAGPFVGVHQIWYADTSIPAALEFRELTPDIWN
jgi:hypothetical protein